MPENEESRLTAEERNRIREEMRYALAVMKEAASPPQKRTRPEQILSFLSNGFVLLIVGALITSYLVPLFQRQYEKKQRTLALMQECFSQYLLYTNSIWQEYYAIFPLVHNQEIDKDTYNKYVGEISQIKLRRYDAFAKVQALAIVFRGNSTRDVPSDVEQALQRYAIRVNAISEAIDTWLRNLYCAPDKCITGASVDPRFVPYTGFLRLQTLVQEIQNDDKGVSELIVSQIKLVE
jgi:hypothetical protein